MFAAFNKASSPWLQKVLCHRAWILVGLTILFVVVVRVRLREMPLERDEGEYAYVGQLMLHGVPPYREAYAMKLPGTYAAYALIMAVFGQSAAGIHVGLALVNAASIVLMFLLGRRLLGEAAGVTSAVAFALLSLSPSVMGLAAHATHFVVLAALGGILFLLRACGEEVQSPRSKVQSQGAEVQGPGAAVQSPKSKVQSREPSSLTFHAPLFLAGLLFGLAFLMKQHGLFFGLFGAVYLLRVRTGEWLGAAGARSRQPGSRSQRQRTGFSITGPASSAGLGRLARDLGWFALGWLLPYGLTCLVLWLAGAFHQFVFWTITYAAQYASAIPIVRGPDVLRATLNAVVGPNLILWVLPWVGALVMWWESRLDDISPKSNVQSPKSQGRSPMSNVQSRDEEVRSQRSEVRGQNEASRFTFHVSRITHPRFFLTVLLLCSFASASVGLYFREHYFILVLPVLALLTGVAVSRGLYLLKHDQTIELFLAVPILGLFVIAVCAALIGHGAVWLALTPEQAIRSTYGTSLFTETVRVADYLKAHAAPDARVAVLGSEPEIYFYAHRRAATGHLYMYPLMEEHPYALKLEEQVIGEIERARPEYVVYVDDQYSWLTQPSSPQKLFEWWKAYWAANLDVVQTIDFQEGLARGMDMDKPQKEPPVPYHILILKRRQ